MIRHLYRTMTGQTFEIRIYGYRDSHYAEVDEVVDVAGRFVRQLRIARYNGLRKGELFAEPLLADLRGRAVAEALGRAASTAAQPV